MSKLDDKDLDNVAGGTAGLNQGPSPSGPSVRPAPGDPPEDDGSGSGGGGGTPLDPDTPNQGVNG